MEENKPKINKEGDLKILRTYMTDMADSVRANEVSVIKVALAEQNKKATEELYRKVEGTPAKKTFWFIGGIILIVIALYGSYYLLQLKSKNSTIEQVVKVESIIPSSETKEIILNTNDSLSEKIKSLKQNEGSSSINNSITFIPVLKEINNVKEIINTKELFTKLNFAAPSSLVRSLSDSYMIGTYNKDSTSKLFLLLKSKDYEYSYAGMLDWEKTLESDLVSLFEINKDVLGLSENKWKDVIINNKDARVLVDTKGRPMLYYLFVDKSNILISDSDITIKEITTRLMIKK